MWSRQHTQRQLLIECWYCFKACGQIIINTRGHWVQTCTWLILSANLTKRKKLIRICGSNQWQKTELMEVNVWRSCHWILRRRRSSTCEAVSISQVPLFLMSEYSLCSFLLKKSFVQENLQLIKRVEKSSENVSWASN